MVLSSYTATRITQKRKCGRAKNDIYSHHYTSEICSTYKYFVINLKNEVNTLFRRPFFLFFTGNLVRFPQPHAAVAWLNSIGCASVVQKVIV